MEKAFSMVSQSLIDTRAAAAAGQDGSRQQSGGVVGGGGLGLDPCGWHYSFRLCNCATRDRQCRATILQIAVVSEVP